MISFVPTPSAAPVSALTILLVVEFVFVFGFVTTGFTTDVGVVVFVVGVVVVLVVTDGLVVDVGVVIVGFVVVGFVVTAGLVVTAGFVLTVGFAVDVSGGFVVAPLVRTGLLVDGARAPAEVPPEVMLEPPEGAPKFGLPPEIEGSSSKLRITLPKGARSRPLACGSCLLDVRFFRIAIFILPS
jgi:hypothetical protein